MTCHYRLLKHSDNYTRIPRSEIFAGLICKPKTNPMRTQHEYHTDLTVQAENSSPAKGEDDGRRVLHGRSLRLRIVLRMYGTPGGSQCTGDATERRMRLNLRHSCESINIIAYYSAIAVPRDLSFAPCRKSEKMFPQFTAWHRCTDHTNSIKCNKHVN